MSSFTSSSSRLALGLGVLLSGLMVGGHEFAIRHNTWSGGFLVQVDNKASNVNLLAAVEHYDPIVIGSSRAKESIRPGVLDQVLGGNAETFNAAHHSGTSTGMVHELVGALAQGRIRGPRRLLVTVEPLHFSTEYVRLEPNKAEDAPEAGKEGWISWFRHKNNAIQSWLNSKVSDLIFDHLHCSRPIERRPFFRWVQAGLVSVEAMVQGSSPWRALEESYRFHIIEKGVRFFSTVTLMERGYEGHTLNLRRGATWEEAFFVHSQTYRNYVLPNYSDRYFDLFTADLKTLRDAGSRIVLVRLPIYHDLYELEQSMAGDFDSSMQSIADSLGLPYLQLQDDNADLASDPTAFTDGSHLDKDRAPLFTERLGRRLREYFK